MSESARSSRRWGRLRLFAATVATIALASPVAFGQTAPASAPSAVGQPQPPETPERLAQAFPQIAWDGNQKSVLLAVQSFAVQWHKPDPDTDDLDQLGPDASDPATQRPLQSYPEESRRDADFIARHFRRKLVTVGGVTVFAPQTMVQFRYDLPPAIPNAHAEVDRNNANYLAHLEASLTSEQWELLSSPKGLGYADLTPAQQPTFAALLPKPGAIFVWDKHVPAANPADSPTDTREETPLGETQRQAIRLRVDRTAFVALVTEDGSHTGIGAFHANPDDEDRHVENRPLTTFAESMAMQGEPVAERFPNRLKPGDLDFLAHEWNAEISLEGLNTVGDIMAAIRKACHVDVYADGRFAGMEVALKTPNRPVTHAADLLQALCWALTATYRKVGPAHANGRDFAYVLTNDREGLAAQRARIANWASRGDALEDDAYAKDRKRIHQVKAERHFRFAPGYLLTPTPEAEKIVDRAIAESDGDRGENVSALVPVADLTAVERQQLQESQSDIAKANRDAEKNKTPRIRTDCVQMSFSSSLTYVIPEIGDAHANFHAPFTLELGDARQYTSADALQRRAQAQIAARPVDGTPVILAVAAPRDSAEAEELVTLASARRVPQVWLDTDGMPTHFLADCVKAGKAHQVRIGAIVDLMRAPDGALPAEWQNLDLFGQTGTARAAELTQRQQNLPDYLQASSAPAFSEDVLCPDQPKLCDRLMAHLTPLVQTEGLSTLILRQAAAPGYDWTSDIDRRPRTNADFGYTVENRLEFLRSDGYDPIDIDYDPLMFDGPDPDGFEAAFPAMLNYVSFQYPGPVKPEPVDAVEAKWRKIRVQQQWNLLAALRVRLDAARPYFPVYLTPSGNGDSPTRHQGYKPWNHAPALPSFSAVPLELSHGPITREVPLPLHVYHREDYKRAIAQGTFSTSLSESGFLASQIRQWLQPNDWQNPPNPSIVVLDLTAMPLSEALPLIRDALLPTP